MNIVFVTQWFDPEGGSAAIPGAMVRALEDRGNRVDVVTGYPNYPSGQLQEGYKVRPLSTETRGKTRVHRVALYPSHDGSGFHRALNFLSFMLSASTLGALVARRSSVALVYSTPATVGMAGVVLRTIFRQPFVLYIQDLWPDTVVATGMLPRMLVRVVTPVLSGFCKLVYGRASRIAVISPGMKQLLIERGVRASKVDVIYNWVDEDVFRPEPTTAGDNDFRVMYAGNLGEVQGLDTLIRAVDRLRDVSDLRVILVGHGVATASLKDLTKQLGLCERISFEEAKPIVDMSAVMASAHVQLVSLRDLPLFYATMPSKVQATLACGRPIIVCAPGDAADLVRSSGAGIVAVPQNVESLEAAIRTAYALRGDALEEMGRAGREFYERELSAKVGARRLESSLAAALAGGAAV